MKNELLSKTNFDESSEVIIKIKKIDYDDDYVDNPTQDWSLKLIFPPIEVTWKELIKALLYNTPDSEGLLAKINEASSKFVENKEKYEKFKPVWFEHAPKSAQEYRKDLVVENDLKQMEYLQKIVSYNPDWTINILPLKKTFSKKLSQWQIKWVDLQKHKKKISPYELLSDYNDDDLEESKKNSDWYKLINIFNKHGNVKWDTEEWAIIFGYMSWLNGTYFSDLIYTGNRRLEHGFKYYCSRTFKDYASKDRVRIDDWYYASLCWWKNMS